MSAAADGAALPAEELVAWLRREGEARYHANHPFHLRMHDGSLSFEELRRWVVNRYYYQTRIPIKDALILSKSEDPAFRRAWIRRVIDHDGTETDPGEAGIALWERLGQAFGVPAHELHDHRHVHPGVRFACDGYVSLVREGSLLEAVASSLTEFFAPDLMAARIEAWQRHYPFIDADAMAYFRARLPRARRDSSEAIDFVVGRATTLEKQRACVAALVRKTEVLWHMLDCIEAPR